MSMAYVRRTYGVPVKRGGRVRYTDGSEPRLGTIKSASHHVWILLDGDKWPRNYHPTWKLEYLDDAGNVIWPVTEPTTKGRDDG